MSNMPIHADQLKTSIVSFSEAKKEIIAILNRNRSSLLDEGYFSWRYEDPFGEAINCMAEIEGRNVGLLTLFPRPLRIKDKEVIVCDVGHIAVDKEYRRKGIFSKLLAEAIHEARKRNINTCFCIPNEMAKIGLLKAGWKQIGNMNYYKKVLNAKPKLKKLLKSLFLAEMVGSSANLILKFLSLETFITVKDYHLQEVSEFGDDFNYLWQKTSREAQISRVRDAKFLTWRFSRKPGFLCDCRILELRKERHLIGYAIIETSTSVAKILDLFCLKDDILPLIKKTISYLRKFEQISSVVIGISSRNKYAIPLMLSGFILLKERLSICCFPNSDPRDEGLQPLMSMKDWYITFADKDTI